MSLLLVEVIPISLADAQSSSALDPRGEKIPNFSAPLVKLKLRQWSLTSIVGIADSSSSLGVQWEEPNNNSDNLRRCNLYSAKAGCDTKWAFLVRPRQVVPLLFIEWGDPTQPTAFPCWVVGFSRPPLAENAAVSEDTVVRILPAENGVSIDKATTDLPPTAFNSSHCSGLALTDVLSGEVNIARAFDSAMEDEVLCNHDTVTVESLKLRMALLLSQPVRIGTTADSLMQRHQERRLTAQMQHLLQAYSGKLKDGRNVVGSTCKRAQSSHSKFPSLLWEGSLTVHSPLHGSGKTLLVKAIARRWLKCTAIHVIQPGPLIAKYGVHADAGLESLLHGITMSAAAHGGRNASICIILDHLDAFLPPALSGCSGAGDAAVPVLNGISAYLKGLSVSLKRRKEFPFPTKNPLYNLGGRKADTLSVRVCMVGIATCPVDGRRSTRQNFSGARNRATVLDALAGGQFRLQDLSARTRLVAFQKAFEREGVELSEEAMGRLPLVAASAVSARGNTFRDVAIRLRQFVDSRDNIETGSNKALATFNDIEIVFATIRKIRTSHSISPEVSFLLSSQGTSKDETRKNEKGETDLFRTVGGNMEAKRALEDALALDPERRRQMAMLGFSAPTGILLYGPPGTGKTKLAKAVAQLLKSQGRSMVGGTFISLRASDIVRAQVGNGEKALVRAFETARTNAPSVIFIDEFQALFTQRSRGGSGRLTSTLLQCMDDVSSWRDADETAAGDGTAEGRQSRVVVIGATNTPWTVDRAFLRPGRFDEVVHVGLPSTDERVSILMIYIQNMRLRNGEDRIFLEGLCTKVAERCDRFSGADIEALCRAAAIRCLGEYGEGGSVEEKHFLAALKYDVSYSSSKELVQRLLTWHP